MTKRDFPPIHPGEILLEDFLQPMQISQYYLAQAIGVPPRRINEIVHGVSHPEGTSAASKATTMASLAIEEYLRLLPSVKQTGRGYLWMSYDSLPDTFFEV